MAVDSYVIYVMRAWEGLGKQTVTSQYASLEKAFKLKVNQAKKYTKEYRKINKAKLKINNKETLPKKDILN